ncbi:MAG: SpvB/TcaC N-terminal domain-containing protein, partial [Acidimicrobiales bacterium]
DFFPKLSLAYDSGAGNGPFGLGSSLSVPAIARKTDKGVPEYRDEEDSDTYILSGAEDLVPVLVEGEHGWGREVLSDPEYGDYRVERYRPRTEGLFARIERWRHRDSGDVFWRAITPDNVTSIYGRTAASRIADPADPTRVFEWLLERTYDDRGSLILYEYKQEDAAHVDGTKPQERNRLRNGATYANRYLKRIRYGNRIPHPEAQRARPFDASPNETPDDFYFEVALDYGEHPGDAPGPNESTTTTWPLRPDPFSSYRAGFEIRTQRLCNRVLMFHRFPELGPAPSLVRATEFVYGAPAPDPDDDPPVTSYDPRPIATCLMSVTQSGYRWKDATSYVKRSLPPVELDYA